MFSVLVFKIPSLQSSNRCAHLHESHRTLRDGSALWGGAVPGTSCQATIAPSLRDISQQALSRNWRLVLNAQTGKTALHTTRSRSACCAASSWREHPTWLAPSVEGKELFIGAASVVQWRLAEPPAEAKTDRSVVL